MRRSRHEAAWTQIYTDRIKAVEVERDAALKRVGELQAELQRRDTDHGAAAAIAQQQQGMPPP